MNLRCRKYRPNENGCKFKAVLKHLNIHDPNTPGFYDQSNLEVQIVDSPDHNCEGYNSILDAVHAHKTRNSKK